jgi:hypothetical protein
MSENGMSTGIILSPTAPRPCAPARLARLASNAAHGATLGIRPGERAMVDVVESLILDLLEWVAARERTYEEVMDAWRTSCPRFPVWEDANDRGLVTTERVNGRSIVRITSSGAALLEQLRVR